MLETKQRISPVKSNKAAGIASLVGIFILLLASVYIKVLQVRYGQEIQNFRTEVSLYRNEVRDLRCKKSKLTAFTSIDKKAKEMGMIFPNQIHEDLVVFVPEGRVPASCSSDGKTLDSKMNTTKQGKIQIAQRKEYRP